MRKNGIINNRYAGIDAATDDSYQGGEGHTLSPLHVWVSTCF